MKYLINLIKRIPLSLVTLSSIGGILKARKVIFLSSLLFLLLISCKRNSVEPGAFDQNYPPGRRDYTWTADTIKAYLIYFNSIWGITANDVWAVSGVGSAFENIYRYDGTKWYKEVQTPIYKTVSLWGTNDNVWICCQDGRIWNFNKIVFSSSPQFLYNGKDIDFFSIAGKNNNEVYAGGVKNEPYNNDGIIYKYNGSSWQLDNIIKNSGGIIRVRYSSVNNKYYFSTYIDNTTQNDSVKLYEYNGKDLKVIYQNYVSGNTSCTINDINGYLYVTIGHKIYMYYNNNFNQLMEINNSNFGGQTWGRNKNDILIRMNDGLMHYNGTDEQYILKFPINITFGTSALVLDKDVFLHAFDDNTGYNIIYHGQLK